MYKISEGFIFTVYYSWKWGENKMNTKIIRSAVPNFFCTFRNLTFGSFINRDAGISFLLVIVSVNNTKTKPQFEIEISLARDKIIL